MYMASSSDEYENENVVVVMEEALIIAGDNVNGELINANKMFHDLQQQHPPTAITRTRRILRDFVASLQAVVFGTKLFLLFPAIPLAVAAQNCRLGRPWIFALSLIGLTPLAERVSFLTEQIACYTSPTVGGLLNATCGNATELIIALFALHHKKIHVLKYSLLGSIISNLLLVLGSSLICGGLANFHKEQSFDKKQTDVNSLLLMLGLLCHVMPLVLGYAAADKKPAKYASPSAVGLARASSIVMLIAYIAYLFFQLKSRSHKAHQASQDDPDNGIELDEEETSEIGFWSAFVWLSIMTVAIAVLSEFVVGTIEDASNSWGISVSFISIILLPIVGNAAEHASSIIFAFKNKLDISLGVALGSASQISMFVVPLCVIVAWIMGIEMDLDFGILETASLAFTVILTALTLQDGNSHYMKGVILLFSYIVIGACLFLHNVPLRSHLSNTNMEELSHPHLGNSDA